MYAMTQFPLLSGQVHADCNLLRQFCVLNPLQVGTHPIEFFDVQVARFSVSIVQLWHTQLRIAGQTRLSHSIWEVGIA